MAAAAERDVRVIGLSAISAAGMFDLTERALDLAAQSTVRPTIGQIFSLDDAAAAHAAIESRATTGKTHLVP